ncbi:MAG TPA: IS200/IS605 family transposase [Phycisphaerae bacterium]|nr:IS200/IS605 family transposase [Phycisphaerae bacterium]
MPQSLAAVHVHLIFSTKERHPFLHNKILREELHAYLGGISKQLDCPPVRVGGVEDHVHILAHLGRTIALADWVKELKRVSSIWLKEKNPDLGKFQWQAGYAAFSVSQSNLEQVENYVAEQDEHHRKMSYQDELRAFFHKHEQDYDERFVWD